MNVAWSPDARSALERISEYLSRFGEQSARKHVQRIERAADNLATFAELGRVVPEIGMAAVRELIIGDYRLLYLVTADGVEIVTVFHGSMSLNE